MSRKNLFLLISLSFFYFIVSILSGAIDWLFQYFVVTFLGGLIAFFIYSRITRNVIVGIIVFLPFFITYAFLSIRLSSYQTFPIWIIGFLSQLFFFLILKQRKHYFIIITYLLLISCGGYFCVMPKYLDFLAENFNRNKIKLKNVCLVDEKN